MSLFKRLIGILAIGLMVAGLGYERVVNASLSVVDAKTLDEQAVASAVAAAIENEELVPTERGYLKPELSRDAYELEVPEPPQFIESDAETVPANSNSYELRDAANIPRKNSVLTIALADKELPYYAGADGVETVPALDQKQLAKATEEEVEEVVLETVAGVTPSTEIVVPQTEDQIASADQSIEEVVVEVLEDPAPVNDTAVSEVREDLDPVENEVYVEPEEVLIDDQASLEETIEEIPDPKPNFVPAPSLKQEYRLASLAEVAESETADRPLSSNARVREFEAQLSFPFQVVLEHDLTRRVDARYPLRCFEEAESEEIVLVRFRVNSAGRVFRTGIAATTNECLNKAALAAAKRTRFDTSRLRERASDGENFVLSYIFEKPTDISE